MTLPSSPIKPHTKPYDVTSMQSNWLIVMGAFLLAAYMLFAHLGGLALISPDEGRNAEVAREELILQVLVNSYGFGLMITTGKTLL